MEEIPKWVIDYNNAGYQSGAGRAVKLLMEKVEKLEAERSEVIKALMERNEKRKSDLDLFLSTLKESNTFGGTIANELNFLQSLLDKLNSLKTK